MSYRPDNLKNPYPNPECDVLTEEHLIQAMEYSKSNYEIYEEALDAILTAIWKMAKESPTKTFVFDSRKINIFGDNDGKS